MSQASTTPTNHPSEAVPLEQQGLAITTQQPLPARITTPEQYALLGAELKAVNTWLKAWNGHHDPIIAAAHETHRLALKMKAQYGAPAETRKRAIAQLIGTYDADQRRLAQEAFDRQRRIQEDADRERRANEISDTQERRREADAERVRLEGEATAARELAAQATDVGQQRELEDLAELAEREAGDRAMEAAYEQQATDQLISAPIVPAFVEVRTETPAITDVATRTTWFAEVVDGEKYLAHLLANYSRNEVLIAAMIEKAMPALNREATNVKKQIEIAPGVFARPKYGASVKS